MSKVTKTSKNKIGGVKLGQGSYGCVVTPPTKCLRNPFLRKNNHKIDNLYVSKIIDTKYSEVSFLELNIGKKLLSLDQEQNFLIPMINACYFTPQKHNDIVYLKDNGRHISSSPDSTEISNSFISEGNQSSFTVRSVLPSKIAKEYKNKCILNLESDYINLFALKGGDNLNTILNLDKEHPKIKFLKHNYWYIFSYMIYGLYLLHSNDIIHKDIKPANVVVSFEYLMEKNITNIDSKGSNSNFIGHPVIDTKLRYIDFGLSLLLNRRKYNMNDITELFTNGTHYYTPMDVFAIRIISKLLKKHPHEIDKYYDLMLLNTNKIYHRNRDYYHYEGIRNNVFGHKHNIHENDKENIFFLNSSKYEATFKQILELYKTNKLGNIIPKILKGWDIFSLGITLSKIIIKCDIHDKEFNDIIFKMIDFNIEKRITIQQLIKIPQFIVNKRKIFKLYNLNNHHSSFNTKKHTKKHTKQNTKQNTKKTSIESVYENKKKIIEATIDLNF